MKILFIVGILITQGYSFLFNSQAGIKAEYTMNRLAESKSPYLLQHADNPVDWYPWGIEAFEQARKLHRPIFLSIGYSTCHWCHVMEHESFEDEEVARLLNESFICIKVDREEMPEVDHVYMSVCQAMTGSGGWPLTIIMTPEKKPFFAGTYFPKHSRGQRIGLLELLPAIIQAWTNDRAKIDNTVNAINDFMQQNSARINKSTLSAASVEAAVNQFAQRYDAIEGGFGRAPKFPAPHNLIFLLRHYESTHDPSVLDMVTHTLNAMRRGGIYDHVGYGFHRYSTDQQWIIPHFEKMLYDQALLALVYLETYKVTDDLTYANTAEEIFKYIERDMTDTMGGYFSAEDADSEGEEGKFYTWTIDELQDILTIDEMIMLKKYFNYNDEGNFADESSGQKTGRNILFLQENNNSHGSADFNKITQKIFKNRELRVHPLKDDKILTDWNGLMIAAKARGAIVLNQEKHLKSAEKAARFILNHLRDKDGRLWKRYRDGEAGIESHLDDYAFLIWGLIEVYQAGFDIEYLEAAVDLTKITMTDFWDDGTGSFFLGSKNTENLFIRPRTGYDGAIPSGNSIMAMNLLRLGRMTGNANWIDRAHDIWNSFSEEIMKTPSSFAAMLTAFHFESQDPKEIVIVGRQNSIADRPILDIVRRESPYNSVLLYKNLNALNDPLAKVAQWTQEHHEINGKTTVFVCENFTCKLPTSKIDDLRKLLNE